MDTDFVGMEVGHVEKYAPLGVPTYPFPEIVHWMN